MLTLIAAALVAGSPPPPTRAEKAWRACVDAHATNYDWGQCGGAYVKAADAALNASWMRLLAHADGKTRADLLKEERAWIAFKETSCAFYGNGDWGREGEVLHFFGCRGAVIESRTAQLNGISAFLQP